jgi:hypothetical protein
LDVEAYEARVSQIPPKSGPPVRCSARFSPNRHYRYSLDRVWNESCPLLVYVLLNPSQADETRDDPTIKRCIARGLNGGFGGIEVVNLFAWRATYESGKSLARSPDPVGPENDWAIVAAVERAGLVICGWGRTAEFPGILPQRAGVVLGMIRKAGKTPHALKLNADGSPRHPLYLSYALDPFPIPSE